MMLLVDEPGTRRLFLHTMRGMIYSISYDGRTVIRGGFRLSYDDIFNNIPVNQSLNAPFVLTTTQRAGLTQPAAGYAFPKMTRCHFRFPLLSFWERLARFVFLSIGQFSMQVSERPR